MELKYLNTVKTILETGSFQNAARKLNYTQSTITFQVQQLEQELSVKLFEKIGRKMVLTQAGKDILPYINVIIQSVEQLSNYGKSEDEMTGKLNVAMAESLLTYKMQPALRAFREQAPKVKLSMQMLNCADIRECLINGAADIGIHYDIGGYNASVITETLASFELSLIAAPALDPKQRDFVRSDQRKDVSLISSDPGSIYQKLFGGYLREKRIKLDGAIEIWSLEAVKRSVASNLGIAFLPRFTVEEDLENGSLQELKSELENRKITAIIACHKNKWISPAMELFIRLVKENIK